MARVQAVAPDGVETIDIKTSEKRPRSWCFCVFIDPELVRARDTEYDQLEQDTSRRLEVPLGSAIDGTDLPEYKKARVGST